MTSTEFTVGLDGSRVSSKVLKPPGGGSSNIFGLSTSQVDEQCEQGNSSTKNRLFGSAPINTNSAIPQQNQIKVFLNNNEASLSKKPVRRNPITGEVLEYAGTEKTEKDNEDNIQDCDSEKNDKVTTKPETPKVIQTSIRVRNPPGGKSSGIF